MTISHITVDYPQNPCRSATILDDSYLIENNINAAVIHEDFCDEFSCRDQRQESSSSGSCRKANHKKNDDDDEERGCLVNALGDFSTAKSRSSTATVSRKRRRDRRCCKKSVRFHLTVVSNLFFVLGSGLYLWLSIKDYNWAIDVQSIPEFVLEADDDWTWVEYHRVEEDFPTKTGGGRSLLANIADKIENIPARIGRWRLGFPRKNNYHGIQEQQKRRLMAWEDSWWDELPRDVQAAAELLGYSQITWDYDGTAYTEDLSWDELSLLQQEAAGVFGYTQQKWDDYETANVMQNEHTSGGDSTNGGVNANDSGNGSGNGGSGNVNDSHKDVTRRDDGGSNTIGGNGDGTARGEGSDAASDGGGSVKKNYVGEDDHAGRIGDVVGDNDAGDSSQNDPNNDHTSSGVFSNNENMANHEVLSSQGTEENETLIGEGDDSVLDNERIVSQGNNTLANGNNGDVLNNNGGGNADDYNKDVNEGNKSLVDNDNNEVEKKIEDGKDDNEEENNSLSDNSDKGAIENNNGKNTVIHNQNGNGRDNDISENAHDEDYERDVSHHNNDGDTGKNPNRNKAGKEGAVVHDNHNVDEDDDDYVEWEDDGDDDYIEWEDDGDDDYVEWEDDGDDDYVEWEDDGDDDYVEWEDDGDDDYVEWEDDGDDDYAEWEDDGDDDYVEWDDEDDDEVEWDDGDDDNYDDDSAASNDIYSTDWDDFAWLELPDDVKAAANVLGYTKDIWDNDGTAYTDDLYWKQLTIKEREAAAVFGYDQQSWDYEGHSYHASSGGGNYSSSGEYTSEFLDDDYVFRVGRTWVSKEMIIFFSAAFCFVVVGLVDWIRERKILHAFMVLAGIFGLLSAMLVEKSPNLCSIFNLVSVHFFLIEAFVLIRNRLGEKDLNLSTMCLLVLADAFFAVGSLMDVALSYLYLNEETWWNLHIAWLGVVAAVLWVVCSLIYVSVTMCWCRVE